MTEQINYKT